MYWGDYLRDTRDLTTLQHGAYLMLIAHYWQHEGLPQDENQLAAIAGITPAKWKAIRDPIAAKFQDGWKHRRIDDELIKSDNKIMQRRLAGQNGGRASGIARSVKLGHSLKRQRSERLSEDEANGEAGMKQSRTNHKESLITSSEQVAARDPTASPAKPQKAVRQESGVTSELQSLIAAKGWGA